LKYFILIVLLVFIGCGEVDRDELRRLNNIEVEDKVQENVVRTIKKPKVEVPKKVVIEPFQELKIKNQHQKEMQKMEFDYKKDELKSKESIQKNAIDRDLRLKEIEKERELATQGSKYELYQVLVIVFTILILSISMLVYFYKRRKLELEKYDKLLEIAMDKNIDIVTREQILDLFKGNPHDKKLLGF